MFNRQIIDAHHDALHDIDETLDQLEHAVTELAEIPKALKLSFQLLRGDIKMVNEGTNYITVLLEQYSELMRISSTSLVSPESVPEQVLDTMIRIFGAERAGLILDDDELTLRIGRDKNGANLSQEEFIYSTGIINRLKQSGDLVVADAARDPEFMARRSVRAGQIRSIVCLHLKVRDRSLGFLYADNPTKASAFDQSMLPVLRMLGAQSAIAIENVLLFEQVAEDLEQTKALTNELQLSRQRILTEREEERRRLARDFLHDEIAPTVDSLVHRLDGLGRLIRDDPDQAGEALAALQTTIQVISKDMREVSHNLYPPALYHSGLVGALRQHIRGLNQGTTHVSFDVSDDFPSLNIAVETAMYRISLAALDNVMKHAAATVCSVRMIVDNQTLSLEINDNGRGLRDDCTLGLGILSMRQRAVELGGTFQIRSHTAPRRTEVLVRIPVQENGVT